MKKGLEAKNVNSAQRIRPLLPVDLTVLDEIVITLVASINCAKTV
jgi:hypothetical protein